MIDPTPVQEAFSRQSGEFDAIDAANPLIGWVRDRVRRASLRCIRPGDAMLELNAGTGIDSVFFADRGVRVLATDQAEGMLHQLRLKQREGRPLEVMALSFHDLDRLHGRTFDHVFSNFGGLNCTDRLGDVLQQAYALLRPGGHLHLVIMPRTSPWELLWVLQGRFREAFRRRHHNGAQARLEGVTFPCHYYDVRDVRAMLPPDHRVVHLQGLSVCYPPPHAHVAAARWPMITRLLGRLEDAVSTTAPFNRWGDHVLLILQRPQ